MENVAPESSLRTALNRMRPKANRYRRTVTLVGLSLAVVCMAACANRELFITDFSETVRLINDANTNKVMGIRISAELSSGADITVKLGCNGIVHQRLNVTAKVIEDHQFDWYSNCAELSFETLNSTNRSLRIRYQFQEI